MRKAEPLTRDEVEALLGVLAGELRALVLLALVTRRPTQEILAWRWYDVAPFVRELADCFQEGSPSPDAPLFPRLIKLPHRFFDPETEKPPGGSGAVLQLCSKTLAGIDATTAEQATASQPRPRTKKQDRRP